jgi:hypothetical protein
MSASRLLLALPLFLAQACMPAVDDVDSDSSDLTRVPDSVRVNGTTYDVETEYLPRVVQCENPGAPTQALRAQAIAARTYLTYRTAGQRSPSIGDGQQEQVFTCASNHSGRYVAPEVQEAVKATRGQVMIHNERIIAGFFVAGAHRTSACERGTDPTNTERFVTINVGQSGGKVKTSIIGSRTDPANRGAMGQNLANCLAARNNFDAVQLLGYFYGADIQVRGASDQTTVPTPREDDPAIAPIGDSGGTTPTPTPTPTTPTQSNPDPVNPDPPQTPDMPMGACWSYTLQRWARDLECVQSLADRAWYQCVDKVGWLPGVTNGAGPGGACSSSSALP